MFGVPGGDGVVDYFFLLAGRGGKGQMAGVSGDASDDAERKGNSIKRFYRCDL